MIEAPTKELPEVIVTEPSTTRNRAILLTSIYFVTFAVLGWFVFDGYSYYMTPYAERPHHEGYREFRPAGSAGLAYGIAGATMMILMLIYTVRKRTRWLGRKLPLRYLLDYHIYFGVIGPLLIVLHTSFKVQGLVAVGFWSMVAVAVSGYFGRYLYSQIPHNMMGNELSLKQIERTNKEMTEELRRRFHLEDAILTRIDQLFDSTLIHRHKGAFASVGSLMIDDILRPIMRRRLRRTLASIIVLPGKQGRDFFELSFRRAILHRRMALLAQVQRLFHHWYVIHKPFAIVMYIIMGIHIGVALWTGYGWF